MLRSIDSVCVNVNLRALRPTAGRDRRHTARSQTQSHTPHSHRVTASRVRGATPRVTPPAGGGEPERAARARARAHLTFPWGGKRGADDGTIARRINYGTLLVFSPSPPPTGFPPTCLNHHTACWAREHHRSRGTRRQGRGARCGNPVPSPRVSSGANRTAVGCAPEGAWCGCATAPWGQPSGSFLLHTFGCHST